MGDPFILLDDARPEGASEARLYRAPTELVIARRPQEVAPALARVEALSREGWHLAGYLAYEAGLALEPRLAPLAAPRTGAAGPLVWFGAFDTYETIAAAEVPQWLAANAGEPRRCSTSWWAGSPRILGESTGSNATYWSSSTRRYGSKAGSTGWRSTTRACSS